MVHLKQGLPKNLQDMSVIKRRVEELRKAGIVMVRKKGKPVSLDYKGKVKAEIDRIINSPRTADILT